MFTWPDDALKITFVVIGAIISHLVLEFLISRVVKKLKRNAQREAEPAQENGLVDKAAEVIAQVVFDDERHNQRVATIGSVLRHIVRIGVYTVMVLTIMSILSIPMGPLLASAGIGGIALGFGAQTLVKDFIAGIFMLAEDQYGVGDFVHIGELSGTVKSVNLRVTKIQDNTGTLWHISNGEIHKLGNVSKGWSTAIVNIPVAYNEVPANIMAILDQVMDDLKNDPETSADLVDKPFVAGVEKISGGTMTLQIRAKCQANKQWQLERQIRDRCKRALDQAGVQGPQVIVAQS